MSEFIIQIGGFKKGARPVWFTFYDFNEWTYSSTKMSNAHRFQSRKAARHVSKQMSSRTKIRKIKYEHKELEK